jgi:ABC-type Fe3+ transport system permease subunit
MATYLKEGQGENLAAAVYAFSFLAMGFVFGRLNHHLYVRRSYMLTEQISEAARQRTLRYAQLGQIPYALATGLAFVSPYLTIVICGLTAVYYALPIASGADRSRAPATR